MVLSEFKFWNLGSKDEFKLGSKLTNPNLYFQFFKKEMFFSNDTSISSEMIFIFEDLYNIKSSKSIIFVMTFSL